jgi:hypothetical protein
MRLHDGILGVSNIGGVEGSVEELLEGPETDAGI